MLSFRVALEGADPLQQFIICTVLIPAQLLRHSTNVFVPLEYTAKKLGLAA